jgi:small subunit ribosomal protein S16
VAVKIRLKRLGKVRVPQYRIVVVDSRKKRDGRVLEEIGKYHPKEDPSYIDVTSDRAQYWLGVGAQPTEAVEAILKITGDWQTFKGLPGTEGTLRVAEAKRDKLDIFNEALAEAHSSANAEAVTKKASAKKSDTAKSESAKADKVEDKPAVEAKPTRAEKADKADTADQAEQPAKEAKAEETPAVVPASETPQGAADEAESAETVTAEDAGKSEA